MPVTSDDALVNRVIENDRRVGLFILGWQNDVIKNNWHVQNYTRRQAMSRVPREVKDGLKLVNDFHLQRLKSGFFDEIFREGARSIDPSFFMTPADTRKVQAMSVDYYTKMRNARAFAARDSERFVSHVWEDTKDRRKRFGRTTQYLDHYGFKGRRGDFVNLVADPDGVARMDRRFGVKAAVGADGRKYNYTSYSRMQGDAFVNKIYNEGAVTAAERLSLKGRNVVILVSDGPDCGWTYHDDPEKADGMVVSIAEARANPIAHPHCQRRFSISTKPKDREKATKRETLAKAASKAIAGAAVAGLSAYGASAAANVAASAFARFAASDLYEAYIDHLRNLMFNGDHAAQHFLQAAVRLQDRMIGWDERIAAAKQTNAQLFPFTHAVNRMWPGGPDVEEIAQVFQGLRAVGDDFIYHAKELPDDVIRFLNNAWPLHRTEEQLQLAFEGMQKFVRNEENRKNLVSVINAEFQRRNVLHNLLLRIPGGEAFASKVTLTWSQWGQRLRLDPFDWLRGHITFTPTGLIRSISFFPKTAFRGVVKMYQDGSIGGHLSALPKNFMNGVFRAIVEVNEHGALVGNIRIVPKGPLRVTLEFITKQPKEVAQQIAGDFTTYLKVIRSQATIANMTAEQVAEHLVFFLQNHSSPLGFHVRDLAQATVRELRAAKLIDEGPMAKRLEEAILARGAKLTFDPRDIVEASRTFGAARVAKDLGYAVRQFRFNRAVVEWRIFNKSIFDISANLRIPVDLVKSTVESLRLQHALSVAADGRVTGTFKFILHSPEELFKTVRFTSRTLQEEGGVGLRSTLFGNIRFSGLKASEDNPFLRALRTGRVRFLSRVHFDQDGLAEIATNMRIFGWNIYDIANVLKVRVSDVKAAINEGISRTHMMAYRLGFTKLDDAIPLWDEKVETVRGMFGTNEAPVGRAEAILRTVKAMTNEFTNPVDERALKFLAGIKPSDSPTQIRLKLLHLRNWINTVEARPGIVYRDWEARGVFNPFTGFPPDVDANILKMLYLEIGDTAKAIPFETIKTKADEIYRGQKLFRLRPEMSLRVAQEKVDYYFGRFQAFFTTKGWAQDHILRAWDALSTHFDLITRKFIPNSWQQFSLTREEAQLIDNWKQYAVPEGERAFRVGDVRFSIAEDAHFDMIHSGGSLSPDELRFLRISGRPPSSALIDIVDENYIKETLKDSVYLRRRYPNIDIPEHRLVVSPNGPNTTYYQDGTIHWAWEWGRDFTSARNEIRQTYHLDQVSGHQQLFRRYTEENHFRRVYFHEYSHYLVDHLTNKQVDELLDVIDRNFHLATLLHDPVGMQIALDQAVRQGFHPRDLLGNAFAAWERQLKLRRNFHSDSSIESLRFTQRFLGKYATMNPDELVAESMSHYLNFRDPSRASRAIGEFMDEKIVGAQGRLLTQQARPTFSTLNPVEREIIEDTFQTEVASTATHRFLSKALEAVEDVDIFGTAKEKLERVGLNVFFMKDLNEATEHWWFTSFDNVRRIRTAWLEMHGTPVPGVNYGIKDVVTAMVMDSRFAQVAEISKRALYRGISYNVNDPEALAHIVELTTVGHQFRIPLSSLTENNEVASMFSIDRVVEGMADKGVWIEIEKGARIIPLRLDEIDQRGLRTEVLAHGTFEVVRVQENWKPSRVFLKKSMTSFFSDAQGIPPESEIEDAIDASLGLLEGNMTRVVLRYVGE